MAEYIPTIPNLPKAQLQDPDLVPLQTAQPPWKRALAMGLSGFGKGLQAGAAAPDPYAAAGASLGATLENYGQRTDTERNKELESQSMTRAMQRKLYGTEQESRLEYPAKAALEQMKLSEQDRAANIKSKAYGDRIGAAADKFGLKYADVAAIAKQAPFDVQMASMQGDDSSMNAWLEQEVSRRKGLVTGKRTAQLKPAVDPKDPLGLRKKP